MTAPCEGRITSAVRRQLGRLPPEVATAVVGFLTVVLPENSVRLSKPLTGELAGLRSARRGDHHVLVDVDVDGRRILVVRVAHRSDAYRPPPPSGTD